MTEFDAEKFEDKYVHYFNELQRGYKNAFSYMNERYDSKLIHAIDQEVLNESEPFYQGDGEFRIDLPENPTDRVRSVVVEDEKLEETLSVYVERLEYELARVFGFEPSDPDEN
ncbi:MULTISPECIES: DUF5783 family protein [unclassified Haladaptatus]|uniref:DUF5783 family protein n=1 Tax=unclassified Haladaptatus TaxID=2622732 RepID=UPI00209C0F5F|nr:MULTISPECIES: DUF5783 family protein [unclassified Haladaptatus]MCO8242558.1 DUF5783 family protein [Haladaptatus sp. AB643]MCO8252315.1 DUF5783 family protein [Haladaptatus sp. AB618]